MIGVNFLGNGLGALCQPSEALCARGPALSCRDRRRTAGPQDLDHRAALGTAVRPPLYGALRGLACLANKGSPSARSGTPRRRPRWPAIFVLQPSFLIAYVTTQEFAAAAFIDPIVFLEDQAQDPLRSVALMREHGRPDAPHQRLLRHQRSGTEQLERDQVPGGARQGRSASPVCTPDCSGADPTHGQAEEAGRHRLRHGHGPLSRQTPLRGCLAFCPQGVQRRTCFLRFLCALWWPPLCWSGPCPRPGRKPARPRSMPHKVCAAAPTCAGALALQCPASAARCA
jgi:hypothetical protein